MWHLVETSGQHIHKVQTSVNPKHENICAQTIFEGLTAVETSEIFINTRQSIRLAVVTIEQFVSITRLTNLAVLFDFPCR